jgi:phosphatidylserine decarboxylase
MATVQPHAAAPLTPEELSSVQPGGLGLCGRLEVAWGRLRRRWLRRVRPGYVRRMAGLRQGTCPDCPHDILDPRDLKYCRNVCGYWFRDEDDPFRWRQRIPFASAGRAELVGFSLVFLALLAILFTAAALLPQPFAYGIYGACTVVAVLWAFVLSFFRDPPRRIPADAQALLSPADGTVTDVGEVDEPDFPGGRAFRISIFLSVFNVHVNRIPRTGRVVRVRYFRGAFLDARAPDCAVRNEQLWIDLEESDPPRPLRVKQISGAIARRIVCWLRPGEEVRAGDRFGMIKFGSRTDVLLPAGNGPLDVRVKVSDKVKGGSTILLRFLP